MLLIMIYVFFLMKYIAFFYFIIIDTCKKSFSIMCGKTTL